MSLLVPDVGMDSWGKLLVWLLLSFALLGHPVATSFSRLVATAFGRCTNLVEIDVASVSFIEDLVEERSVVTHRRIIIRNVHAYRTVNILVLTRVTRLSEQSPRPSSLHPQFFLSFFSILLCLIVEQLLCILVLLREGRFFYMFYFLERRFLLFFIIF